MSKLYYGVDTLIDERTRKKRKRETKSDRYRQIYISIKLLD